ncbi:MAG: YiiX family permuted papain-like enzyme [Cyclobacteriaceae bacterium]|nr:YiiX family permuted papain-like enzyme [Cyclobacteriaceae bacterium]
MKKLVIPALIGVILIGGVYARRKYFQVKAKPLNHKEASVAELAVNELKDGDLIFQTSTSKQSKAIQLATKSKYSHCGIIYRENNSFYVFEAIQPVKRTPLVEWIARGKNGEYVVKRLIERDHYLTSEVLGEMKVIGDGFAGKDYDPEFDWSDDRIYCSELIWKIYKRATGLEIGYLQNLSEFDLSSEVVKNKLKERYGDEIPKDEKVISPGVMFDSELLEVVRSN